MEAELHGGPMDGERAYVLADDPDPGTALISPRCAYPGGRSIYEPDDTGRWTWRGDTP
ncbi:hypothetical protein [Kitasatospora cineracea]|uniref:Uncharacterized protein n=1 Tax=Kitasatospora cineracea TaxID=88074 RepID=A0A8G1UAE4_9ACTN|nr:hypothetical protein [Kitasatospora cineracea]ROR35814.1 hypothetical protein EDD39_7478 [Kitasatospora cineracea]